MNHSNKINANTKYYIGILTTSFVIACIGIYSIYYLKYTSENIQTLFKDRVVPIEQLTTIRYTYLSKILLGSQNINNHKLTFEQGYNQIETAQKEVKTQWNAYTLTYLTPEEKALTTQAYHLMAQANTTIERLKKVLHKKDSSELQKTIPELSLTVYPVLDKINELVVLQVKISSEITSENLIEYKSSSEYIYIILILLLAGAFLLSYFIYKSSTKTAENKINSILEVSPDTFLHCDSEGNLIEINEQTISLTGYSKEELLNMNVADLFSKEELEKTPIKYKELVNGETVYLERVLTRKDQSLVPISVKSKENDDSTIQFFITDISKNKSIENELKQSEEKYRKILEEIGDVVYTSDDKGYLTYINPACEKLTGYTQKELEGKKFSELVAPEWKIPFENFYLNLFKNSNNETLFSFVITTKSGEQKWVEQTITQFKEGNKITGNRVIMRDITERKKSEAQIEQKSIELEKTNEQLTLSIKEMEAFAYSLAHDLRSPVRAVNGYTNIIEKKYSQSIDQDGKDLITLIISESLRMGQLIDDLLTFSRLGKKEIEKTLVNMTALAKEVTDALLLPIKEKNNTKIIVKDLPVASCDITLMRQVFENLIANAIKFSQLKPDPYVEIGSFSENSSTVYYIKDNGEGFDMQYAGKLFGVFQRLHRMNEFKGTGIGLAIARRIIVRHGGKIWGEGKLKEGATFYFSLP